MKRFAAMLCICLLLMGQTALAAKKEKPVIVPYTQSESSVQDGKATVKGTRAWVDFQYLRTLNKDTVGWLYQEETCLSQPILQSQDNELYEKRSFDMAILSNKGSVHIKAEASPAMTEDVLIIHGSGREGACLELLNGYKNQAYYEEHKSLRLLTPLGDYQADVFASIKTGVRTMAEWYPGAGEDLFSWRSRVQMNSELLPDPACLPNEGERVALFVIKNSGNNRRILCAALRPIQYETEAECDLTKAAMDRELTYAGRVEVGPLGKMMLYAQNDPAWGIMRYESELTNKYRHFDGGGCGPTAAAIAVANLVDEEKLSLLRNHTANGIGTLMCPCSVNRVYCNHTHAPYLLETQEEYLRYLPIAMADFAAGNNEWGVNSRPADSRGSNVQFFDYVCEIYGLNRVSAPTLADALEMLKGKAGQAVVLCYALRGSPFTNSSHYVVIAGVDEQSFYVLDPWRRTEKEYAKTDKRKVLEYIAPGVVRIPLEDARKTDITPACYVERTDKVKTAFGE